jgi:apolipoprotein N-acyltransferase
VLKIIKGSIFFNKDSLIFSILGLITFLSYSPFNLFFINIFIYSVVFYKIFQIKELEKFINYILLFSFFKNLANFYWITFSLITNSSFIALLPLAIILLPLYKSLITLAVFYNFFYLKEKLKLGFLLTIYLFSLCLFLDQLLFAKLLPFIDFKGLPWDLFAYNFYLHPNFMQIIAYIGVLGLSLIACFYYPLGALLYYFHKKNNTYKYIPLFLIFALPTMLYALGSYRIKNSQLENITNQDFFIAHTNNNIFINSRDKAYSIIKNNIKLLKSSKIPNNSIGIITEGTVKFGTKNNYNPAFKHIQQSLETPLKHLIIGSAEYEDNKIYNSLFIVNESGIIEDKYRKRNLVPFGEYTPYGPILPAIVTKGSFSAGKSNNIISLGKNSFIPLICYDSIFSGKIPKKGDFLLNITNDIWFTKKILGFNISNGTWQHYDISRARSIEEGKPLIRAANYGISAVNDSFGREIVRVDYSDKEQLLKFKLPKKLANRTLFNKFHNQPTYLIFLILILIFYNLITKRRN